MNITAHLNASAMAASERWAAVGPMLESWLWAERESLFLWLPVALGTGVAAWFGLPGSAAWAGFMLLVLGMALGGQIFGALGSRVQRVVVIAGVAMAVGCALAWIRSERVAAPVLERAVVVRFEGVVESTEILAARESVRLIVRPDAGAMLPPRVRVTLAMRRVRAQSARASGCGCGRGWYRRRRQRCRVAMISRGGRGSIGWGQSVVRLGRSSGWAARAVASAG